MVSGKLWPVAAIESNSTILCQSNKCNHQLRKLRPSYFIYMYIAIFQQFTHLRYNQPLKHYNLIQINTIYTIFHAIHISINKIIINHPSTKSNQYLYWITESNQNTNTINPNTQTLPIYTSYLHYLQLPTQLSIPTKNPTPKTIFNED